MTHRYARTYICQWPPCSRPYRPLCPDSRTCSHSCDGRLRTANREVSKRAYHLRARAHLRAYCEGVKPSGKPCRRIHDLHVHHRDRDYTNNDPANLLTLCRACHIRAHGKRTWRDNNRRLRRAS